jgi:ribosomal protein S18 acetylase RimI-like enzyme
MEIRPAQAQDISALAQLWEIAWHDAHFDHVPKSLSAIRTPESFLSRLTVLLDDIITIGTIGEPLGFVIPMDAEIYQIMVGRDARGTGAATKLMNAGEQKIRENGHKQAYLDVIPENLRAIAFYEKMGWIKTTVQIRELEGADAPYPLPCLVMFKDL